MNCGVVVLMQTAVIPTSAILASPVAVNLMTLPAGSKIVRIFVDVTVALVTATNCGLTIGQVGGAANTILATFNTGTGIARVTQATVDSAMAIVLCNNVGTVDLTLTATPTAATASATAGTIIVSVQYIQRAVDGTVAAVA